MTISTAAIQGLLDAIFLNQNFGGTILASGALSDFFISGHTSDPSLLDTGTNQTEAEADYIGYGRAIVPRTAAGWIRNVTTMRNFAPFNFGENTGGTTNVLTHLAVGTDISAAGYMFNSYALKEPVIVIPGMTPQFLQQEITILMVGF